LIIAPRATLPQSCQIMLILSNIVRQASRTLGIAFTIFLG